MLRTTIVMIFACMAKGLHVKDPTTSSLTRRAAVLAASTALASPRVARASVDALDVGAASAASPSDVATKNVFEKALETTIEEMMADKEIFLAFGSLAFLTLVGEYTVLAEKKQEKVETAKRDLVMLDLNSPP